MDDRMPYSMFVRDITAIKHMSDELNDGWELLGNTEEGHLYLRQKVIKQNDQSSLSTVSEEENSNDYFENINLKNSLTIYEYHVAYNISYGVPVLCLKIWNSDGKLFNLEEAWKLFKQNYIQENMYSVLTQNDHPVLKQPFLILHPCKTIELLRPLMEKSENSVVSWLSAVGPAINLNLSNEYAKLTFNEM